MIHGAFYAYVVTSLYAIYMKINNKTILIKQEF